MAPIPRALKPGQCPRCGHEHSQVERYADDVDFKGLRLEVHGLVQSRCTACRHSWETAGQNQDNLQLLRHLFATERDRHREQHGLLTGEEITALLAELGITRAEAAALLGGGPHAFAKYASGEVVQSIPMDRLLRLLRAFGHAALAHLREGPRANAALHAGWLATPTASAVLMARQPGQAESAASGSGFSMVTFGAAS